MNVPVAIIRRKMIIRKFLAAGAVSPETAKDPSEVNVFKASGFIFSRLEANGILLRTNNNKYYVNTAKMNML